MKSKFLLVGIVLLATTAFAQAGPPHAVQGSILDSISLPGQFWSVTGPLDPVEHGNLITEDYFEQGVTIFATDNNSVTLMPYASVGFIFDTKGFNYNNKVDPAAGLRLNKYFRSGVVSIGTAIVDEDRFMEMSSASRSDYAQYWFGWNPASDVKSKWPGESWGVAGTLSPIEHGNYILQDYASQSYVLARFGSEHTSALMPYIDNQVTIDSQGFDWENSVQDGGGLKFGIPHGQEYTEILAGFTHEKRLISGVEANGFKFELNFSYAWGLFGRKGR